MSILKRKTSPVVEITSYDLAIMAHTLTEYHDQLGELTIHDIPRPDLALHAIAVARAIAEYSSSSTQPYRIKLVQP